VSQACGIAVPAPQCHTLATRFTWCWLSN